MTGDLIIGQKAGKFNSETISLDRNKIRLENFQMS